jgi:pimeloyl-ACP methyl ester carboxylesterase
VVLCLGLAMVLAGSVVGTRPASAEASVMTPRARTVLGAESSARSPGRGKESSAPISLASGRGVVLAYPPRPPLQHEKRPLTVVYLHGIHGRAENGCPWLRNGATELGWLVCPEANMVEAPGFTWAGSAADKHAIVREAERAAQAHGADAEAPGVLVGFSQGSYVALELVHAGLGRYRGLVLLAADVTLHADELAAAGVTRAVLDAGDLDGASAPMKRAAERLTDDRIEVRYASLGRVGHTYVAEEPSVLREAIAWAGGAR